MTADASPYDRIGGAEGVERLVESFYRRMESEPGAAVIRAMHPRDLSSTRATLKRYLSEWMGGPKLYTPEKGHPRLRHRHLGFAIDAPARDAWLVCMRGALLETVADAKARADLDAALSRLADHMRNQPEAGSTIASPSLATL